MRRRCECEIYDTGDQVEILESGVVGTVIGYSQKGIDEPRYTVEYIDSHGNPREEEWRASSLAPWGGDEDDIGLESDIPCRENIIPFPQVYGVRLRRSA